MTEGFFKRPRGSYTILKQGGKDLTKHNCCLPYKPEETKGLNVGDIIQCNVCDKRWIVKLTSAPNPGGVPSGYPLHVTHILCRSWFEVEDS